MSSYPPRNVTLTEGDLEDFAYASSRRDYFRECSSAVDLHGTKAAEPFILAQQIGQHMQDQMKTRNLHIQNVYRGVMRQLFPDGLDSGREKILRDLLYRHWEQGRELKVALGEALPETAMVMGCAVQAGDIFARHAEVQSPPSSQRVQGSDPVPGYALYALYDGDEDPAYSLTREAGPGW